MTPTRIYYLVSDCGDGSCSVHFFRTKDAADDACNSDNTDWDESYNVNDGGPGHFDVYGETSGINFKD